MKKMLATVAMVGMVASVNAADLGAKDAEFMFGQNTVNAVAMSSAEMMQTEGQLLEILGLVGSLPIVGPILESVLAGLDLGALVAAVPAVVGAAFPIHLDLGLNLGALLTTQGTAVNIDSALPTLLGAVL